VTKAATLSNGQWNLILTFYPGEKEQPLSDFLLRMTVRQIQSQVFG